MKANELRIGNWVKVDDLPEEQVTLEMFKTLCEMPATIGFFRGIPLTEAWLLKLGFLETDIPNDRKTWGVNSKDKFGLLYEWKLNVFTYGYIGNPTEVKYVHQLQNLYFALTGEELK